MGKKEKTTPPESYIDYEEKGKKLDDTLKNLAQELKHFDLMDNLTFNEFLYVASTQTELIFRDIFKYFHDMIEHYVPEGVDDFEITDDSVGFIKYDFSKLFTEDCDDPFFADRLFANRFMNLVEALSKGTQNNHIILFEGPPGSGKSTFLNNLLFKLENYSKTPEGVMYKSHWKLDVKAIKGSSKLEKIVNDLKQNDSSNNQASSDLNQNHIEISCPSNDNPILQIPKKYRRKFIEDLIPNGKLKNEIFNAKEYKWIFKENPCSICSSIFEVLMDKLGNPIEVFNMLYAKKIRFNRQYGKGITVFNPGDEYIKKPITDITLQSFINSLFQNDEVRYVFSNMAYTNNGVYALMDIKDNNIQRLIDLHGIISDGTHKVEFVEERVKSLFVGLVNPEDKKHYENVKSFQDRIMHVNIPYILDYNAEVMVYKQKFGLEIENRFLPGVLQNFAKIIIASRMETESYVIKRWITDNKKYSKYIDKNLLLLKMELYKGDVPEWLTEDDIKKFTKAVRKDLISESETEGKKGISGRQSLSIFNNLLTKYADENVLITMDNVKSYFIDNETLRPYFPDGFISSLEALYDYNILHQIKESLYFFSEKQIQKHILDYLFAINFDIGNTEKNDNTGTVIEIDEAFFTNFETTILGADSDDKTRKEFRKTVQKEYITFTLAKEIKLDGKSITSTKQFQNLYERYTRNIKENALTPYIDSDNFRRAVIDYGKVAYKNCTGKLKGDVARLITRLKTKFHYTEKGAIQVTIYALDKKLYEKFD